MNLFNKVAVFTDLHLGNRNNSAIHNQDCEEYIDWFIDTAKANGCDTGIFMGDYTHTRNTINIVTMDYSVRLLEKLGKAFDNFYFILGNHDIFFKDKRDIHSVGFGKHIPGITLIEKPTIIGNTLLCPWMVGTESRAIGKKDARYAFGHFELPNFYMNSKVKHPAHGELTNEAFLSYELVFSGHFHMRQYLNNIHYIGNAFPHNFADAWDDARGMMILEWGGQPVYYSWPDQPTFRTLTLSKLIDEAETILRPKQHLRVTMDIGITFEEAQYIKENFITQYRLRELTLIPERKEFDIVDDAEFTQFESIDHVVTSELTKLDSNSYNVNMLLDIYNNL